MARGVSAALNNVVNCLPGQRVVEDAIEEINAASQLLNSPDIKVRRVPFQSYMPCIVYRLTMLPKNS